MKKTLLIIVILFVLLTVAFFSFDKFDRFNPQYYQDVSIYSKQGEKRSYKVSFNGYNPSQQYVKLKHKGTYVEHIEYISKQSFPSLK